MAPKLYMAEESPPARAVLMVAKAISLNLETVPIDLFKFEHLTPEFLKINPQHTIPTLVDDDGFTIWDSHAITVYLISKYAKDRSLLPKDGKQRAILNQRLHFDSGILFPYIKKLTRSIIFDGKKTVDDEDRNSLYDAYELLDKFLENWPWIAGETFTVADYHIIASVSSLNKIVPIDSSKLSNLAGWMEVVERLPAYEANRAGLQKFGLFFKNAM